MGLKESAWESEGLQMHKVLVEWGRPEAAFSRKQKEPGVWLCPSQRPSGSHATPVEAPSGLVVPPHCLLCSPAPSYP